MHANPLLLGLGAASVFTGWSLAFTVPGQILVGKAEERCGLHQLHQLQKYEVPSGPEAQTAVPQHAGPSRRPPRPGCTKSYLTAVLQTFKRGKSVNVTVETTQAVPEGGGFGEGGNNLATKFNATRLPELCAVIVRVQNYTCDPPSDYRFGLFLPVPRDWNGRFLAVGNGAFLGGINWPYMGSGPHYGFATMSTDTGHNSGAGDLSWGLDRPDRLLDWGYRAVRGSVIVAKHVVTGYYRAPPRRSYFTGCSTGGRQALKAIQGDPESFDGALVGAPAWDTKHLMPWGSKVGKSNLQPDGSLILDVTNTAYGGAWDTLVRQVQLQCDGADGVVDGIVSAPEKCNLDFARFTCQPGTPQMPGCLTPEQVAVVQGMYSDYRVREDGSNADGDVPDSDEGDSSLVLNGMEPSSETDLSGWPVYLNNPVNFLSAYEKYFLYNDTKWELPQYTDQVVVDSRRVDPGQASADDHDLSAFKEHGGKVILYHGVADGLVPTRSTTHFYNTTRRLMGGQEATDDFLRHFLVPGMGHCWFSPSWVNAPWMFAGVGQANALQLLPNGSTPTPPPDEFKVGWGTPLFRGEVEYDALLKLLDWVENDVAPDDIRAVAYGANWTVARTRKLCPYPKQAILVDTSNVDDQAAWECQ